MAAVCNFFIPGLGHLILGKPFQALLWFVLVIAGYLAMVVPGVILHIICIIDAARQAKRDAIKAVEIGVGRAMAAQNRRR